MTGPLKNKAHEAFKSEQERSRQKVKAIEKRLGVPQAPAHNNQTKSGQRIDVYYTLNRIKQKREQQSHQHQHEQTKQQGKSL